jgi:precorrin isomerase
LIVCDVKAIASPITKVSLSQLLRMIFLVDDHSNDGEAFVIDEAVALASQTIKYMIKDVFIVGNSEWI